MVGDSGRLQQILTNLAENAIKFTDRGGVQVIASRVESGAASLLEIRVIDTGVGISAEVQSRIFRRFEQGDSSITRRWGGAGLGLAIVKFLVAALGGEIRLSSTVNQGTEVVLRIPVEVVESEANATVTQLLTAVDENPAWPIRGARILLAEDNDANFFILGLYLSKAGCIVERAANGIAAVDLASRNPYDVILMDIEMPELDGYRGDPAHSLHGTRAPYRHRTILALTAHVTKGYRDLCFEAGCSGYLSKPIRKQALLEAVSLALKENNVKNVSILKPKPTLSLVEEHDELDESWPD